MKKSTKKPIAKHLTLVSAIILINFLGVSYASFNDGLNILASVSAGKIDPVFGENTMIEKLKGSGNLTVDFPDYNTMTIQGTVYSDYDALVNYALINQGSLPVKLVGVERRTNDGLVVELDEQPDILAPQDTGIVTENNAKLHIQSTTEGNHNFELALIYNTWK